MAIPLRKAPRTLKSPASFSINHIPHPSNIPCAVRTCTRTRTQPKAVLVLVLDAQLSSTSTISPEYKPALKSASSKLPSVAIMQLLRHFPL